MDGIVVLISGRGSNLRAFYANDLGGSIKAVISNQAAAKGLIFAQSQQTPTHIIEHKHYPNRELFDQQLIQCIEQYKPKLVVLAGFMRILSTGFVNYYRNRLINIHPSLLPCFKGADAQGDALKSKVKVSGATVHLVTEELDHGPIIAQGVVGVRPTDSREELALRILDIEHVIYPFVIRKFLAAEIAIDMNNGEIVVTHTEEDKLLLGKYQQHIYY